MGIMTRLIRLWKADVHGVMDQLEDKGLLLKQYLREMETSLGHKQRQAEALTQRMERISGRIARQAQEMDKLEEDLHLALSKQKDDIARMLIRKRRGIENASVHLRQQIETLMQEKSRLSETLSHQQLQYETLKAKADVYCRRAGDPVFETTSPYCPESLYAVDPSDEEIELELLQRKETMQTGGTP